MNPMIKMTNTKTGEVTYYPEKDERITVEKFKKMSYAERCELYNSDRSLYDSLVYEMNGEKPKTQLSGKPWDYSSGPIIRKE